MTPEQFARDLRAKQKGVAAIVRRGPRTAGRVAVNEFRRNIEPRQGLKTGYNTQSFAEHAEGAPYAGTRKLLKRGNLLRGIRILGATSRSVTVGVDTQQVPYAEIHQTGGTIPITPAMRKYFWAKFYETSGQRRTRKDGRQRNTSRNRRLNATAQFYKRMALKKTPIKIPQRQYMQMNRHVRKEIEHEFKQQLRRL